MKGAPPPWVGIWKPEEESWLECMTRGEAARTPQPHHGHQKRKTTNHGCRHSLQNQNEHPRLGIAKGHDLENRSQRMLTRRYFADASSGTLTGEKWASLMIPRNTVGETATAASTNAAETAVSCPQTATYVEITRQTTLASQKDESSKMIQWAIYQSQRPN